MKKIPHKRNVILVCAALTLAAVIAFEPMRHNGFLGYDDPYYVTENPNIQAGLTLKSIIWAFTNPVGANWHPLTTLSHMLDCQLFGQDPFWHHFTNLLLHIANTLLLFWVLNKMTAAFWPCVFVAAIFAVHPLRVESVAWVAERKDVLSGLLWMLTMAAYLRYVQRPSIGRYLLVLLSLCLGLMAKPMLVTLPFVLLLLDFWPLRRVRMTLASPPTGEVTLRRCILEKLPLLLPVAVSCIITYLVQQKWGAMTLAEFFPLKLRISNAVISYVRYIAKIFYPNNLAALYPYPLDFWPAWQVIGSLAILIFISVIAVLKARRYPFLLTGWLWYLITLVPVIGFAQVGAQAIADRYTYIPSIGVSIMFVWSAARLDTNMRLPKFAVGIAATLVLLFLLICSRAQVRYWRNSLSLYEHTLAVTQNNYMVHNNYAAALSQAGRYDEAIAQFTESIRINPNYTKPYEGMGRAFMKQAKYDDAIACFNQELRLKPDHSGAHYYIGVALQKQGKIEQAVEEWKKELQINPDFPEALSNLGVAMLASAKRSEDGTEIGKLNEAVDYLSKAVAARPDWPEAHYLLGGAFYRQGKPELAVRECLEAVTLKPDYLKARQTLAYTLAEPPPQGLGRIPLAVEHYYKALQYAPDDVYCLIHLARILASRSESEGGLATTEDNIVRNPTEAVLLALKACRLTGFKQIEPLDTLSVAYAAAGMRDEAVDAAEKALQLAVSTGQNQAADQIRARLRSYKPAPRGPAGLP
jgi:tetratricopeptide (TPR) repeat protein